MKKVSDILKRKENQVISVSPEVTVMEALKLMAEKNIGSVLVMKGGEYVGLMTERDYARKVVLKGKSSNKTVVAEIMSTHLPVVHPESTIDQCMQLLTDKNIRYLPVFVNNSVVGIISINDVVKEIILTQEETIDNLKEYLYS